MQCPSCYNDSLTATEEGRMLCDLCGEEFAGYRHEELDAYMAGTAVSTRESQSSQARSTRAKITARRNSSAAESALSSVTRKSFVNDELLLCEAVILTTKAIAQRLVDLRCLPARVMKPLFELLTHWVTRRHAGKMGVVGRGNVFRPVEILALLSLAAVYVRSPMLPRDLCRMVVSGELPYPGFSDDGLPEHVKESSVVTALFAPIAIPNADEVMVVANKLVVDRYVWPPIRRFFGDGLEERTVSAGFIGNWTPFPVGHLPLTLLRLSRLLGLPDQFGARVLRFIELRQIASKMSWNPADVGYGSKGEDGVILEDLGPPFSTIPSSLPRSRRLTTDLHGFPSDLSVQIDFINTMRLCYGTALHKRKPRDGTNKQLALEWESCKHAMESWLKYGNPEDLENVQWTPKTPAELSNIRGEEIRRYADMVDDLLAGMGEDMPELWGKYITAFTEIGESGAGNVVEEAPDVQDTRACIYDASHIGRGACQEPLEGIKEMDNECAYDSITGMMRIRPPLRKLRDMPWQSLRSLGVSRNEKRRRMKRDDLRKLYGRKRVETNTEPLGTSLVEIESGEVLTHKDDKADAEARADSSVACTPATSAQTPVRFEERNSGANSSQSAAEITQPKSGCRVQSSGSREVEEKSWKGKEASWDQCVLLLDRDFLREPAGIGLACTMIRRFFAGGNVVVGSIDEAAMPSKGQVEWLHACDNSMRTVILYVLWLKQKGIRPDGGSNVIL